MYLIKDIPKWSECEENSDSALDRFIYDNEPANNEEATVFRANLVDVLNEAIGL